MRASLFCALSAVALLAVSGCGAAGNADELTGEIKIDGSSTVYLITEAMASEFKKLHENVQITVGISGTGGGFKKFASGETDISDASRHIRPAEADACRKNGIDFLEIQVAWDGLTVAISPKNDWARQMTVAQLKRIWEPESKVKTWRDVERSWPAEPIKLYGAGPDSGTFDFFTEAINGREKASRMDYTPTEDDNVSVNGVAANPYALGYFGLAYFDENRDKITAVAIGQSPEGPFVEPSLETVLGGTYKPLSRPLFIYVKKASLHRPEVQRFVEFYLRRNDLVAKARYIKLNTRNRNEQQAKLDAALAELGIAGLPPAATRIVAANP